MPEKPGPTPNRTPLESALAALKPAPAAVDRDRLMYRAGQVSAGQGRWLWPAAAAALLLISLGLGSALALRPAPGQVVQVVYVEVDRSAPTRPAPSPSVSKRVGEAMAVETPPLPAAAEYLRLRGQVLRWGVDALPDASPLSMAASVPTVGAASRAAPN